MKFQILFSRKKKEKIPSVCRLLKILSSVLSVKCLAFCHWYSKIIKGISVGKYQGVRLHAIKLLSGTLSSRSLPPTLREMIQPHILTLIMQWANLAGDKLMILFFFFFFPKKIESAASCKLSVKSHFLGKKKKKKKKIQIVVCRNVYPACKVLGNATTAYMLSTHVTERPEEKE